MLLIARVDPDLQILRGASNHLLAVVSHGLEERVVHLDIHPITHTADGNGVKEPVPSELPDRLWRTDPADGLRPMLEIRAQWQ